MKLLNDSEIVHRIREVFRAYPITDIAVEALCHTLQSPYEGYVIVDDQERIVFLSEANEKFFSVPSNHGFLKSYRELNPTSNLMRVMQTGKAEAGEVAEFQGGRIRIVARFPIVREGKTIGAYGKVVFSNVDRLSSLVSEMEELRSRLLMAEEELSLLKYSRYSFNKILGDSAGMKVALEMAQRVCGSDASVLLVGETGTGKELFANAIHFNSLRKNGPFVRVNCAAIAEELADAELFGYKPGAFTGAHRKGKAGYFRQAHGGTVFLDEIHELSPRVQSKLLRVLQEKEVIPVGGGEPEKTDFRFIAATNQDLSALAREGKFRGDLYFRVNRVSIQIPPLRDRREDTPVFVRHFNRAIAEQYGRRKKEITEDAMGVLLAYPWPGNVRELANTLEQAFWTCKTERIDRADLPAHIDPDRVASQVTLWEKRKDTLADLLGNVEQRAIVSALTDDGGNCTRAAKRLGIHRTLLYKKMKKYGILNDSAGKKGANVIGKQ
ncbi:MAG: sigma 54-interacting transcriptional regulator [bacterium]|nr:sigma 54-interacting transcriptional regulator [bacterium]